MTSSTDSARSRLLFVTIAAPVRDICNKQGEQININHHYYKPQFEIDYVTRASVQIGTQLMYQRENDRLSQCVIVCE